MLSKIIGLSAVLVLFLVPSTADAHHRHKPRAHKPPAPAPTVVVTLGWAWVEATLFRPAHWRHVHYGRSYRPLVEGPPPPRPHAHSVWIPGHWEGRGRNRHWVPGHWRQS